jgi:hypothetical protein
MNADSYPRLALRRELVRLGIAPERHRMRDLLGMLPVRLNGRPCEDFDADIVAEVLIYLVDRRLIEVPSPLEESLCMGWGTHLCHFYQSQEEALELLIPYLRQGLANGEQCVWAVQPPLTPELAREALGEASGEQMAIVDAEDWPSSPEHWRRSEQRARSDGYLGLRIAAGPCAPELVSAIKEVRIKALCGYPAFAAADAPRMLEVIRSHHTAFVRHDKCWQRVQTSDAEAAECILAALIG